MPRPHRRNFWTDIVRRALKQPGSVVSATVTDYSLATVRTSLSREAGRLNAAKLCETCQQPIGLGGRHLGMALRTDVRRRGEIRVEVWFSTVWF